MRPLSTTQLLNLWEQGLAQPLAQWALLVLGGGLSGNAGGAPG